MEQRPPNLLELIMMMKWEASPNKEKLVSKLGRFSISIKDGEIVLCHEESGAGRVWAEEDCSEVYNKLYNMMDNVEIDWWRKQLQKEIEAEHEAIIN